MNSFTDKLSKYAKLVAEVGVNVQKDSKSSSTRQQKYAILHGSSSKAPIKEGRKRDGPLAG